MKLFQGSRLMGGSVLIAACSLTWPAGAMDPPAAVAGAPNGTGPGQAALPGPAPTVPAPGDGRRDALLGGAEGNAAPDLGMAANHLTFRRPGGEVIRAEGNQVRSLALDGTVRVLATAKATVSALTVCARTGAVAYAVQGPVGDWQIHGIRPDGTQELLAGLAGGPRERTHLPVRLRTISSLAFTPEGDLLFTERTGLMGEGVIHRLVPYRAGRSVPSYLVPAAGGGAQAPATGSLATQVRLDAPSCLTVAPDGSFCFVHHVQRKAAGSGLLGSFGQQVCRVDRAGRLCILAGAGQGGLPAAGGPGLGSLQALPDGTLAVVLETGEVRLLGTAAGERKAVEAALPEPAAPEGS